MGSGAENGAAETAGVSVPEKKPSGEKLVRLPKPDRSATDAQIAALNEVRNVYVCGGAYLGEGEVERGEEDEKT